MPTLGDDLPRELARCRKLLGIYKEIGPNGAFGYAMIEADIARAEAALASGDLTAMIRAYQALKGCE